MAKIAKLFIKSLRYPLELTEEQGRTVKRIIDNADDAEFRHLTDDDKVDVAQGLWTGRKGDLRYVVFEQVAEDRKETVYDDKVLDQIEREVEPFFMKEGESEYDRILAQIKAEIVRGGVVMRGLIVKKKIERLHEQFFPKFAPYEEWKHMLGEHDVNLQNEHEMQQRYEDAKKEYLASIEVSDEALTEAAKKIMAEHFVGKLFWDGEKRFLMSKKVATFDGDNIRIVMDRQGNIPYVELNAKLNQWKRREAAYEYASAREIMEYDEMAETLDIAGVSKGLNEQLKA